MDRAIALVTLREHAEELRADGVIRLRLFGSTARDQARADSDVDLLADFDRRITLLKMGELDQKLRRILNTDVDLSTEEWLRDHIKPTVLAEAVLVF